ncbi:lipopolysaccharide biosynthesis protein [Edwardsiella tarda]|uniref:lipopolysaccharide biosynthesis protein n=1 Tax=Edwardsiella tarda TaxID=636 RepID=UPI003F6590D3
MKDAGSYLNFMSRVLNAGVVFFINILVVKFYGVSSFGVLSTYQTIITIIAPIFGLGLSSYISREISFSKDHIFSVDVNNLLIFYFLCIFSLGGVIWLFLYVFLPGNWYFDLFIPYTIIGAIGLSFVTILQSICALRRNFILLSYLNISYKLLFFIFILFLYFYFPFVKNSLDLVKVDVVSVSIVIFPIVIFFVINIIKEKRYSLNDIIVFFSVDFFRNNRSYIIISLTHVMNAGVGIIISYFFLSKEQVGELAFSQRFLAVITIVLSVINNHTLYTYRCKYSDAGVHGVIKSSREMTRRYFFVVFAFLFCCFVATNILSFYLDMNVRTVFLLTCILFIGYFFNIMYLTSGNILIVIGDACKERDILIYSFVANIFLSSFIPFFGVVFAAMGISLSMILSNFLVSRYLKYKYGSSIFPWGDA